MSRYALLVAAGEYEDATLNRLRAPEQDVERLASILEDPDVGDFTEVQVLRDAPESQLRLKIAEALADRQRDDLVLLYFSCHGIVDQEGRLYFASSTTQHTLVAGTAVSNSFVNERVEACLAGAKVLILDCCFSGAFSEGFKGVTGGALDGRVGRGYVALTASDRYEFAYEGDSIVESVPSASVFTDVIIEGLSSGAADLNNDGQIDIDELFRYAYDGVVRRRPSQKPKQWAIGAEPNIIYLAKVPRHATGKTQTRESKPALPNNYNRHQVVVARGIRAATDLVRLTLGPHGRRVLIQDESGLYLEAGDAQTIASLYRPDDPRDRLGASYIKDLVLAMHRHAGDGAAMAVVLAQAMIDGVIASLRAGANPILLSRGIQEGIQTAEQALVQLAKDVETKDQIALAMTIASGDRLIGEVIAEAMDKVGKDGVLTVEESQTFGIGLETVEGMRLDKGYISPYFMTDPERMEAVLDDPYILVANQKLSAVAELLPLLEKVMQAGKPLVVIAEDVDGEALATLVVNKIRGTFKSVAVKAPGFGDRRKAMLEDMAILTGGQVISYEIGLKLENVDLDLLGRARKVVVTRDETLIVEGAGSDDDIIGRINLIRTEIDNTDSDYDREKLQERLAKLAGGVAVIKVGEATEAELNAQKQRIEAAIRVARLAVAEGLLAGGGIALIAASRSMQDTDVSESTNAGVTIVADALDAPFRQIMANSGIDITPPDGMGVNAVTGVPANMLKEGIIDSAGVLRNCLKFAGETVQRFLLIA